MGLLSSDPGSPPATTSELRGAGIAFVAVCMVAFEGTWLRLLQRDGVPLETYQFWICSGKGLVQLAFVVPNTYRARQRPQTRAGWFCVGIAWFAGFATTGLLHYAGRSTTAAEMFGIFYTFPLFCGAFGSCLLGEHMPAGSWAAFAIVVCCMAPIIFHAAMKPPRVVEPTNPRHHSSFMGDLMALVASIAFAAYLTASRFMTMHAPAVPMALALCGGMLTAAFAQLPLVISFGQSLMLPGLPSSCNQSNGCLSPRFRWSSAPATGPPIG